MHRKVRINQMCSTFEYKYISSVLCTYSLSLGKEVFCLGGNDYMSFVIRLRPINLLFSFLICKKNEFNVSPHELFGHNLYIVSTMEVILCIFYSLCFAARPFK